MKIELTEERKAAIFTAMLTLNNIYLTAYEPGIAKTISVLRDVLEEEHLHDR